MSDFKNRLRDARKATPLTKPDPMVEKIRDAMKGKPKAQPTALDKIAKEAQGKLLALPVTGTIKVCESDEQYQELDKIRADVDAYLKWWEPQYREVKAPLLQATQALDAMNRNMTKPAQTLKEHVTALMAGYKREQLRLKNEAIEEERQRAEDAERKAAQATTPQMRGRLMKQAEDATAAVEQIEEVKTVRGENSHDREVEKWRVLSLKAIMAGVISGIIPEDVLTVDTVRLNAYFKEDIDSVREFPGIEVYKDVQIVSGKTRRYE